MTKKYIHRASADVGLIMSSYNLRRIINTIGIKQLREYFRSIALLFYRIIALIKLNRADLRMSYCGPENPAVIFNLPLEPLYLTQNLIENVGF